MKVNIEKCIVVCNNCGHDDTELVTVGHEFEYDNTTPDEFPVVRCRHCHLTYLNPRPAISELSTIYPPNYFSYSLVKEDVDNRSSPTYKLRKALYARKFRGDLDQCPSFRCGGKTRVLDIGCGDGRILNWYKEIDPARVETYGVDLDERAKRIAEGNGHTVFLTRFEELDQPDGSFDLITSNHVIEHVEDPAAFSRKAWRLLADGGVYAFETPNIDCLDARWFRDKYWGGYHFPRHWFFYTRETLQQMLGSAGFSVISVYYSPNPVFWNWTVHHILKDRGWPVRLVNLFDPVTIFHNSFKTFLILTFFTIVEMGCGLANRGKVGNIRVVARKETVPHGRDEGAA
jgi:2-polyprenyl-3-methyl-5-hydroxy-6-metoxy-1,4-benzoquinol methylase